ncbi:hypothetical protein [Streptomyces sindenensis]|uniref:Uncharacterized protein n=1 Tax=Streptomyces sindenensis TaxID=67363 RepID=A0ABW6EPZ6_9ACTN
MMIGAMVAVWVLPPWRRFAKIGATFRAFLLLTVGAGLSVRRRHSQGWR